jgi:hypothetical protein
MSCARKQRPTEKNNLRSTGLLQRCLLFPIIPPPFWTLSNQCGEMDGPANGGKGRLAEDKAEGPNTADKEKAANTAEASDAAKEADNSIHNTGKTCPYPGPATWLSVIGVNRFWPLAYLTRETPKAPQVDPRTTKRLEDRKDDPGGRPEIPLGMKLYFLALAGFSAFHAWCCWSGSYTAKPGFRAHFASTGGDQLVVVQRQLLRRLHRNRCRMGIRCVFHSRYWAPLFLVCPLLGGVRLADGLGICSGI